MYHFRSGAEADAAMAQPSSAWPRRTTRTRCCTSSIANCARGAAPAAWSGSTSDPVRRAALAERLPRDRAAVPHRAAVGRAADGAAPGQRGAPLHLAGRRALRPARQADHARPPCAPEGLYTEGRWRTSSRARCRGCSRCSRRSTWRRAAESTPRSHERDRQSSWFAGWHGLRCLVGGRLRPSPAAACGRRDSSAASAQLDAAPRARRGQGPLRQQERECGPASPGIYAAKPERSPASTAARAQAVLDYAERRRAEARRAEPAHGGRDARRDRERPAGARPRAAVPRRPRRRSAGARRAGGVGAAPRARARPPSRRAARRGRRAERRAGHAERAAGDLRGTPSARQQAAPPRGGSASHRRQRAAGRAASRGTRRVAPVAAARRRSGERLDPVSAPATGCRRRRGRAGAPCDQHLAGLARWQRVDDRAQLARGEVVPQAVAAGQQRVADLEPVDVVLRQRRVVAACPGSRPAG